MKKFADRALAEINRYFTPVVTSIGDNRYMLAIRNGIIGTIPLSLVGSFFLIIANFPIGTNETFNTFLSENGLTTWQTLIFLPFFVTMSILGIFILYGVTKALCDEYKIDSMQPVMIALAVYITSIVGPTFSLNVALVLPFSSLGVTSVFAAILIAFFSVEVHRFCINNNIRIILPKQVPPAVSKAFSAIIPLLIAVTIAVVLFGILGFDLQLFLIELLSPLQSFLAGNNMGGMIVVVLLITMLWIAGIHGASIVGAIADPFWAVALLENIAIWEAMDEGGILLATVEGTSIITGPFFNLFIWQGGAGATIGLIIAMLIIGKSRYGRSITRSSAFPSLFNINEPIIFGFPVVLNPVMILPFILAPIVNGIISFLVLQAGLVGLPVVATAWTLPTPVGAFLATSDWRSIILVFGMILVSTLIWFPFARIYDRQLLKKEFDMLSEKERNFAKTLNKKDKLTFLWIPDEAREKFVNAVNSENVKKYQALLKNKSKLKAFIKKAQE